MRENRGEAVPCFLGSVMLLFLVASCSDDPTIPTNGTNGTDGGKPCINYADFLHIAGSVDTPGDARGVIVSGNYVYVADSGSGLQVIDITTPASPQIVGSVNTPGSANGVAVSGNYAYVADEYSGLQVIDIRRASSTEIV